MAVRASVSNTVSLALKAAERKLGRAVYAGMDDAAQTLKDRLRAQMRAAGLGDRLANTWRARTYPERKRDSLHPKGTVWSNAAAIAQYFDQEQEVYPVNGARYLAVPVKLLRGRGTGRGSHMVRQRVADVERTLGQKITIIKGRNGNLLGLFDANLDKRKGARRRRGGVKRDLVLYFVFVPKVRSRKLLDVEGAVKEVAASVPRHIEQRLAA